LDLVGPRPNRREEIERQRGIEQMGDGPKFISTLSFTPFVGKVGGGGSHPFPQVGL